MFSVHPDRVFRFSGFSLLELLISLAVVAVGLLGFASLQMVSLQRMQQASVDKNTSVLLRNLSEQIRAMPTIVQTEPALFNYSNMATGTSPSVSTCGPSPTANCSQVFGVLNNWFSEASSQSASPRFSVSASSQTLNGIYLGTHFQLAMSWDASLAGNGSDSCDVASDYSIRSTANQCSHLEFWVR